MTSPRYCRRRQRRQWVRSRRPFRRLADTRADGIICINLSAQLSATMQSAQVRGQGARRVVSDRDRRLEERVDGHRQPRPARGCRAAAGADLDTIVREVEQRANVSTSSPRSTRWNTSEEAAASAAPARLGSMLSIKPVIAVKDGSVDEAGKVRTRSKALRFIVDRVPEHGVERIAVLHGSRQTWTRSSSSSSGACAISMSSWARSVR